MESFLFANLGNLVIFIRVVFSLLEFFKEIVLNLV